MKMIGCSYPEGNFGGNQLLDGSISLSPLCPNQTNDLHVSIATSLHQSFPWLCLSRLKPEETLVEDRSDTDVQIVRRIWV